MKYYSAHFIFTNTGPPLKKAVITAEDDGKIINIEDAGGNLNGSNAVEFYNGVIIPGFVNCHCHLELSHLKGAIPAEQGLGDFIRYIRNFRDDDSGKIKTSVYNTDSDMYREGIGLCADICNNPLTFNIKKESRISYLNLIEVFGIDPEKARDRMEEINRVVKEAEDSGLMYSLVPHSVYSVSLPLFRLLREKTMNNHVTSVHFMETEAERAFLSDHSGPLAHSYSESGLMPPSLKIAENHADAILKEITPSGNLILVHNTYADRATVQKIKKRKNTFWCLCPASNIYIENKMPPVDMLVAEGCEILIGTDSLASNSTLSILSEIKIIQNHFPSFTMEQLIGWATINGARALGEDHNYGTIEPGKKPGLLLLQNIDLINLKLLPETTVSRLL